MSQSALAANVGNASYNNDLTDADFNEIAKLVTGMVGIQITESKRGLVKSRLQKRLRVLGLNTFKDYVDLIKSPAGNDELEELISAISTNVTAFNREPHHFEHFRNEVLPGLIKKLQSNQSVRLWSAGCSNGSEPYTLACSILDALPSANKYDIQILATDIDKYSLETGRSGIYTEDMVAKMPSDKAKGWFSKTENGYEVHPDARSLVSFKTLNLINDWPLRKQYDAIFCRNVMIYFSTEDQGKIISKFTNHLLPEAYLYIGHSERVVGPAEDKLISVGATTYQFMPNGVK